MFKVAGIKEPLGNVIRLTKSHLNSIPNKQMLKKAYYDFLREAQPQVPKPEDINLSYKWKKEEVSLLLEIFKEDSVLDDFEEVFDLESKSESDGLLTLVKKALEKIHKTIPSFAELIDLVIHTIFTFPSKLAGGGSTSAAIGCIWVDIRPHWVEQDVLEFLVHETTHNLVFIDELCYTHYTSYPEISKPENFARSAILNKPRTLDKVFHSILVSTEVLLFRQEHFGHPHKPCLHPPSHILLNQTNQSIDSIVAVERFLTDRAKFLLDQCTVKLKTVELGLSCCV
jgi:hypothetical protein